MTDNQILPQEFDPPTREADDLAQAIMRLRRALIRRVEIGDGMALDALIVIADESERDLAIAVRAYHSAGFSWSEIAKLFGISRQGARQRFGA